MARTSNMELDGSRFVVVGATGVLGGALAHELDRRGALVALLGRDRTRLDEIAGELGGVPTAVFEATDPGSCRSAIAAVAAALGGLDGCVVAHGAVAFGSAAETSDEIAAHLMQVNAVGAMAVLRAAAAHLDGPGALAAVSAVVADHPTAGMAAYSASKAALSAYLTALRREVRREQIAVLDARLPHLETGFAERAVAGAPPALARGEDPVVAATAIVDAIAGGRRELAWDLGARRLAAR